MMICTICIWAKAKASEAACISAVVCMCPTPHSSLANGLATESDASGTHFRCRNKCHAMDVYSGLLKQGVIVRPVANYEMPEYLRVSIGTESENETFIHALQKVLA